MLPDGLRRVDDGLEAAFGGPGAPLVEVDLRQPGREIPERLEGKLDPVGEGRLQALAAGSRSSSSRSRWEAVSLPRLLSHG